MSGPHLFAPVNINVYVILEWFSRLTKNIKTFLWPLSSSPVQLINPFRGVGNKSQWLFVRTVLKKASVLPNTRISRIYLYRVNPTLLKYALL